MWGAAAQKREREERAQQRKSERSDSEPRSGWWLVERTAGHDRDAAGEDAEVGNLLSHGEEVVTCVALQCRARAHHRRLRLASSS